MNRNDAPSISNSTKLIGSVETTKLVFIIIPDQLIDSSYTAFSPYLLILDVADVSKLQTR